MEIELADQESGDLCYSRDFLQRFTGTITEDRNPPYRKVEDAADSGDVSIELSLGLMRSSSTAAVIAVFPAEIDLSLSSAAAPVARAWSVPAEAEYLKRKEMEGLKRMDFKRKRLEKTNGCVSAGRDMDPGGGDGREVRIEQPEAAMRDSRLGFNGRGLRGPAILVSSSSPVHPSTPPAGQNSASKPPLPPRLRSLKSLQEEEEEEVLKSNLNGSKDVGRNIMAEMPFVSTEGGGPNGKRVEGFLYKYRRGGEVRIVCICHGSFHTPAEFVKHAGGGDVPHPLRQIVVDPSPPV